MIDVILVLLILAAAVQGWRQGLVTSAVTAIGWVAGLLAGLWAAPVVMREWDLTPESATTTALVIVVAALFVGALGAAAFSVAGRAFVRATPSAPIRHVDSAAGALALAVAMTFAVWAVPNSARPALSESAASSLDDSRVWSSLDRSMPDGARTAASGLNRHFETTPFPEIFNYQVPNTDLPAPDASVTDNQAVGNAAQSIVKVRTTAGCRQQSVGSGWVVSNQRVVTNAHVVAGASRLDVQVGGSGERKQATVVAFDPARDLAVLRVDGLNSPALQRADLDTGDSAVVAGFPRGGDYHLAAARVRSEGPTNTRDIYGSALVQRDVFALDTTVVPGNSGGPLLTTSGQVAGTVFARSAENSGIGFASTDAAGNALFDRASTLNDDVDTGSCLSRAAA